MIQTEHITKSFGRTRILSGISLHVRDRELVAYLGPNGAGKTTTVRILSGQARADGGTVKLAGRDLTEHPLEAKALCGVVSQHLNLDAELSVRENLDIHGRLFGMNASERKEGITRSRRNGTQGRRADENAFGGRETAYHAGAGLSA